MSVQVQIGVFLFETKHIFLIRQGQRNLIKKLTMVTLSVHYEPLNSG